jgi:hypothetical protein
MRGAVLEQDARKGWATGRERQRRRMVRNARDRLQVFVDGCDVVVGHAAVSRPRHDLQYEAVKGRHGRPEDAALSARLRTRRMGHIVIMAGS